MPRGKKTTKVEIVAESYDHKQKVPLRPDIGLQAQFRKKKLPKEYRYDSSLSPELSWDINADREKAESLIAKIQNAKTLEDAKSAADALARLSKPFLNWAGKMERSVFTVPTLPLFVHERLSTKAILESVKNRKCDKIRQKTLFGDVDLDLTDRILKSYEHKAPWVNRMILGDSLMVMNSLLEYEGLGGQVQMIYFDPPYGVNFDSNFQPFIRKRSAKHGDDEFMTREPEMVQAYRDTWELGIHSYLTYLRDRFRLAHDLLTESGSIFVQISDENVHLVRCLMDEVFKSANFASIITFRTATSQQSKLIPSVSDYLIWYCKNKEKAEKAKFNKLFRERIFSEKVKTFGWIELAGGDCRQLTNREKLGKDSLPEGKLFKDAEIIESAKPGEKAVPLLFKDKEWFPPNGKKYINGIDRLIKENRIIPIGTSLCGKRYESDNPFVKFTNLWEDTIQGTFELTKDPKKYVVQTNPKVIARLVIMTTDPGDLILDPTCGSGTTAFVAEQWGRRWITIDTSRVPLALARQRLLTATFDYYELRDPSKGTSGGFVYKRKQNKKGQEVGGIVSHITLESIANNQPPSEEVLVDRPEVVSGVVRVSGPFAVESTIPPPMEIEEPETPRETETREEYASDYIARMVEILRRSPVLHLPGNKTVTFKNIRRPARAMDIHAEGVTSNGEEKPVAFVFGPENGAVTEQMAFSAAKEAYAKSYTQLYIIGFSAQANARKFIQNCAISVGIPATSIDATMDILMGDLLKTCRASQIFSVTGQPEIRLTKLSSKSKEPLYQVELLGLDVFKPDTMENAHIKGGDVPAWFLDSDYNELAFCVTQAFFPRTSAWDNLKRDLKGTYEDSVWERLAGTVSEPFTAGEHKRIAVKVIDDRGNELMVVKNLSEAETAKI